MKLKNPIVFFDIESTGVDVIQDKIIELYMKKMLPDGTTEEWYSRFNPGKPSSEEAISKHKIKNEDLLDEPKFIEKADSILQFLEGCDVSGYNIRGFDVKILSEHFNHVGKTWDLTRVRVFDIFGLYSKMEPRNLETVYKKLTGVELKDAHQAKDDVDATIVILESILEQYSLGEELEDVIEKYKEDPQIDSHNKIKRNRNGEIVFAFGKHKDKVVKTIFDTLPDYIQWVLSLADFPMSTKLTIMKICKGELQ